jgi:hypothetical protein
MFNYFSVTKEVLLYGMAMLAVGVSVSVNCPSLCNGPSSVNSDRKEVSVDIRIMAQTYLKYKLPIKWKHTITCFIILFYAECMNFPVILHLHHNLYPLQVPLTVPATVGQRERERERERRLSCMIIFISARSLCALKE